MSDPGYPAARAAAPRVRAHFDRLVSSFTDPAGRTVAAPAEDDIEAVIDAAFWTSLRCEEGYVPKLSLSLVAPDKSDALMLKALSLKPRTSSRFAAVERPEFTLACGVGDSGELKVRATRQIPAFTFMLEVAAPGCWS